MLPGFRFLFAAIVLTMSILIFGLGAAALLRASHEQFVSIPARRALPEPVFAQQNEPPAATLALLRVEPPVVEKAPEAAPAAAIAAPVEPVPEAVPVEPVETERLAALKVDEPAPPEAAKPEIAATPEPAPSAETAPVQPAPAAAEEIKVAAVEQAASPAPAEPAPATLPAVIVPPAPDSMGAPTTIAALGSPAVTVEGPASAKPKGAESDESAARKRLRAQRAKERRRLAAQRARLARQTAAAQLPQPTQADPFTLQPTITAAPTSRKR
jgi:hypothetical protein